MAVIIDNLEVIPAAAPERTQGNKAPETPSPGPSETMESALQRLEERLARVWAH